MSEKNYMLKSTYKILLEEINKLRKRLGLGGDIAKELSQAYDTGGQWYDNPHWDGMLQDQQRLIKKFHNLLSSLRSVVFIEDLPLMSDRVMIGTEVLVEDAESKLQESYKIVGNLDVEYNPLCKKKGFILYRAPLEQQLIGKSSDEEVIIILPVKKRIMVILTIKPLFSK